MTPTASEAALKRFEQNFAKEFGEGHLRRGGNAPAYRFIPTGSLALDYALAGGWVLGRLLELWGADDAGKTTLAANTIAQAQQVYDDRRVAFIDVERKLDEAWFVAHGVDIDALFIDEPRDSETVADAVRKMADSGLFSLVVVDSVGGMVPKALYDKDASEEARVGEQAKIVQRMVQTNNVVCYEQDCSVLLINQVRAIIGGGKGPDTTTPGGWGLKHGTMQKVHVRRGAPVKMTMGGEQVEVGLEIAARVDRSKIAPAKRTARYTLFHTPTTKYGPIGIDRVDEAIRLGVLLDIITKPSSAYYVLPGMDPKDKINGEKKLKEYLRAHPDDVAAIREAVIATRADEIHGEDEFPDEGGDGEKPNFKRGLGDPDA